LELPVWGIHPIEVQTVFLGQQRVPPQHTPSLFGQQETWVFVSAQHGKGSHALGW